LADRASIRGSITLDVVFIFTGMHPIKKRSYRQRPTRAYDTDSEFE